MGVMEVIGWSADRCSGHKIKCTWKLRFNSTVL